MSSAPERGKPALAADGEDREPVTSAATPPPPEESESSRTRLYLSVVLVEALVILTLWAFSRHFGS